MKYRYILFDLDGTLTESGPGIVRSVRYGIEKMGFEVPSEEILQTFVGPPLVESLMIHCKISKAEALQTIDCYREYYTSKGMFENSVYDGVEKMLEALKESDRKLAVATSKPEVYARRILEYFHLDGYFDVVCGATFDERRVEKADIISDVLREFAITEAQKKDVLMVGDRLHDICGAKKNGIDSLGVLFGYGGREELEQAGADYLAASAPEAAQMILADFS